LKTLSTDAAAAALGVSRKTLDNILAREARHLLQPGSQGRSRRIPIPALERIAVALILNRDVGITVSRGLEVSEELLRAASAHVELGPLTTLTFDVAKLRAALDRSIGDVLESIAEPTRGRPPL
jgi:hypothetical protein